MGRIRLLERMNIAIELLTRREYFDSVYDIYREANGWVIAIVTGNKPGESDRAIVENLLRLIESRVREGVKVRLVIPRGIDKLYMGYKYTQIGVEVMFHENLIIYDLRYTVADGRVVVMGFPIEVGEAKPTRRGVKVYSETLASILLKNFERYWLSSHAIKYEDYLKQYVDGVRETNPDITLEAISRQLDIPVDEIERVVGR
jgi:hypothetical protein